MWSGACGILPSGAYTGLRQAMILGWVDILWLGVCLGIACLMLRGKAS
jgi:hypothetical protein